MGRGTKQSSVRAGLLALIAAALSLPPALALDPGRAVTQYRIDTFDRDDGLPVASVEAIYQTSDGYLWVGTHQGPARYDGVRFTVFRPPDLPDLARVVVMSFLEDAGGTLWIGTMGGLYSYREGTFSGYTVPHFKGGIRVLFQSRDGTLWVGDRLGPLSIMEDGEVRIFEDADGDTLERVNDIVERADGTLCFAALDLHCLEEGRFRAYGTAEDLPNNAPVVRLAIGSGGRLWAGTFGGGLLELHDGSLRRWTTADGLPGDKIRSMIVDRNGSLWVGAIVGNGLARLRNGSFETIDMEGGLPNSNVLAVTEDREGNIWIGTNGGGLVRLSDGPFITWSEREGISHPYVHSVLEDRSGAIWIGTQGGLNRLQGGRMTLFTTDDGLGADEVLGLHEDRAGALWAGTAGGGINRIEDGRISHYSFPPFGFSFHEDGAGDLWVGTLKGLAVRRRGEDRFEEVAGTGPIGLVDFIMAGPDGVPWLGSSSGGLLRLVDGEVTPVEIEGAPQGVILTSMHLDAGGTVWISTYGGGLFRMRDGRFTHYTVQDGLPSDNLLRVLEDDHGRIWIASNVGVSSIEKFRFSEIVPGQTLEVVTYGTEDGLRSEECNGGSHPAGWKGSDGRLWFPTTDGVAVIDPGNIRRNRLPPPVHVERVIVDGDPLRDGPGDAPIVLPPGRDSFEFQYTALSLNAPQRNRFRYRLDGLDRDWVEAGDRRTAYYTHLPPGRYTFRVLGSNNDGVWNEAGASLSFTLQPHFYQTWWFYALCLAAAGWAGYGVHRYRVARVLELERVRTRIATDLHDDIGASLSQIAILSEVMQRRIGKSDPILKDPLARIGATSRELVDSMSDIVWAINPKRDRVSDVVQRMRRFASDTLTASDIALEFRGPPPDLDLRLGADLRRQLYLVFKESLNNAVRHSGCKKVGIEFTRTGPVLSLSIRDDGGGFDPGGEFDGNGLAGMRRRAAELGGTLRIDSAAGRGTTVHLRIPLKR